MSGRFRVLVAGGAGLLGSAIARQLLSEGASVVVADPIVPTGDGTAVREWRVEQLRALGNAIVSRVDLGSPEPAAALLDETRPSAVINAALFDGGGESPGLPALLDACRSLPELPFFLHLSDAALYGPAPSPGALAVEDEPIEPGGDPLLLQRAAEEEFVRSSGLGCTTLRVTELLGPGFPPGRFPAGDLERLLEGDEVVVRDDERHDFLHVDDAVTGILSALARRPLGQTVNLGTGTGTLPRALLALLAEKAFRPIRVRVGAPVGRPPRVLSRARAFDLFRFSPRRSLEETAAGIVAFRLGTTELTSSRTAPVAPRPAPSRPAEARREEPEPLSRRDLFGMFRRPKGRG